MIESHDRVTTDPQVRRRRRKSAKWKSGLMLTGLGAVVLGAGYLAGVNAPAVAGTSTPQVVAQAGSEVLPENGNQGNNGLSAPNSDDNSAFGQGFQFNDDDNQGIFGDNGGFQAPGDNSSGSASQFNQQFSRRNRQFRGFSQQQPSFSGPVTRSRGS